MIARLETTTVRSTHETVQSLRRCLLPLKIPSSSSSSPKYTQNFVLQLPWALNAFGKLKTAFSEDVDVDVDRKEEHAS